MTSNCPFPLPWAVYHFISLVVGQYLWSVSSCQFTFTLFPMWYSPGNIIVLMYSWWNFLGNMTPPKTPSPAVPPVNWHIPTVWATRRIHDCRDKYYGLRAHPFRGEQSRNSHQTGKTVVFSPRRKDTLRYVLHKEDIQIKASRWHKPHLILFFRKTILLSYCLGLHGSCSSPRERIVRIIFWLKLNYMRRSQQAITRKLSFVTLLYTTRQSCYFTMKLKSIEQHTEYMYMH